MTNKFSSISNGNGLAFVILGVLMGSVMGGVITTGVFFLTPTLITSGIGMFLDGEAISLEDFSSWIEFMVGPLIGIILVVSGLCFIIGCLFLAANRQSGLAKYRGGALTGAICFSLPSCVLSLIMAMVYNDGVAKALLMTCFVLILSLFAGAVGATTFLVIVQIFDFNGRFFIRSKNKIETSINLTSVEPKP
jgi:hypothetical protein